MTLDRFRRRIHRGRAGRRPERLHGPSRIPPASAKQRCRACWPPVAMERWTRGMSPDRFRRRISRAGIASPEKAARPRPDPAGLSHAALPSLLAADRDGEMESRHDAGPVPPAGSSRSGRASTEKAARPQPDTSGLSHVALPRLLAAGRDGALDARHGVGTVPPQDSSRSGRESSGNAVRLGRTLPASSTSRFREPVRRSQRRRADTRHGA